MRQEKRQGILDHCIALGSTVGLTGLGCDAIAAAMASRLPEANRQLIDPVLHAAGALSLSVTVACAATYAFVSVRSGEAQAPQAADEQAGTLHFGDE